MPVDINRDLARKYDTVAYAARANAPSHPGHLATVAALSGLDPPAVATCVRATPRVLQWLTGQTPRIVALADAVASQRAHPPDEVVAARPLPALIVEACYAGAVELCVHPPGLVELPASVQWQVRWCAGRRIASQR